MQSLLRRPQAGLAGIFLLAVSVRLLGINSRPLWYDEAFSILFSEKGIGAMLVGTLTPTPTGAADIHPLGYYSLLWGWMRVFGESLIAVRMLSVLAGAGLVVIVCLLAYELFNAKTALLAGIFSALSPFQIHYAQEIRMYVFMALWLLLATFAYLHATRSSRRIWWGLFALFAALAQYSHNLAAFYLIPLALWPLITRQWRTLRSVALAGLLAMLIYLPWLIHLPAQFAKVSQSYWLDKPQAYRFFTLLLVFVPNLPLPNAWILLGLFIALAVFAISIWQTIRSLGQKEAHVNAGLWMLYLTFAPFLLLFLFSQWKPVYLERALLPSGAVFLIWLAWALAETRLPRPIQASVIILLLVGFGMGIYQHITYSGFPYGPYAALMANLRGSQQPGDVIIHSSKLSLLPSIYYDRSLAQSYVGDPPGSSQDTLALSTQQVLGLIAKPSIESAAGSAQRVWFIIFDQSNQEYIQNGSPLHPHLAWLMGHYCLVELKNWGDLRVYLFATRR
jgi:uncharacterized membrane protein